MPTVAVEAELTPRLLASLRYDRQVVLGDDGTLKTRKTPKRVAYWYIRDTNQDGLSVRVRPGGVSYYLRARNGRKQLDRLLGQYPTMTITTARARAREWTVLIQDGKDPTEIRAQRTRERETAGLRKTLTFGRAFAAWIEQTKRSVSDGTHTDRKKVVGWLTGSPVWSRSLWDVDRAAVDETMSALGVVAAGGKRPGWGPVSVSWSTVSKIYTYAQQAHAHQAIAHGIISHREASPWAMWRSDNKDFFPDVAGRTRLLRTEEATGREWLGVLVRMFDATHAPEVIDSKASPSSKSIKPWTSVLVDYVLILLLWGTRRIETASLRWDDVHEDVVVLRGAATKSGKPHYIPITPWARTILDARRRDNERWRPGAACPFVFPSVKHGKHIDGANSIFEALESDTGEKISAHDLRRTLATDMMEFAVEADRLGKILSAGAMLGHAGVERGGINTITLRYIQRWADALRPLYQQRETKLRRLAGLAPLVADVRTAGALDDDALRAAILADPAKAARIMAEAMAALTKHA